LSETDGHFRAFSFVDRIGSHVPGALVRGSYHIPSHLDAFPLSLVAEAVGQIAAWAAMAAADFKVRPVAGIAASIDLLLTPRPGQTLELAADLDSLESDAVSYSGTAHADGVPLIRLNYCVGPMLAQETFDEPQAVKDRFALLIGGGAVPDVFGGIQKAPIERIASEPGQRARALFPVPWEAPYFNDHFPLRPVFPGTLFMDKILNLAALLAAEVPAPGGCHWVARMVSDSKLRDFIAPGDQLELEVAVLKNDGAWLLISGEARRGARTVGLARLHFAAEKKP
jgi:3-hydroxymyristoyl/3-hydroxydecanoyl-(acyl carrier protein) dehydratase